MAQDGGKVVSLRHRPLFILQEIPLVLISVRGCFESRVILRSEGLCQWKVPMTPSGIEPATFLFVAQHLNHCATAVPPPHPISPVWGKNYVRRIRWNVLPHAHDGWINFRWPLEQTLGPKIGWNLLTWTDRERNISLSIKKERNTPRISKRMKVNWIGHALHRNCILKYGIEVKKRGKNKSNGEIRKKT